MGVYQAQLEQDADGRWSSWIDELPGCAAWGHSRTDALAALRHAVVAYVDDMVEAGEITPSAAVLIVRNQSANE